MIQHDVFSQGDSTTSGALNSDGRALELVVESALRVYCWGAMSRFVQGELGSHVSSAGIGRYIPHEG